MNQDTNILVVEDEALIADDIERTLHRLGYKVPAVVADGEGAIEAASKLEPSLVLMDIKLQGRLDGVDAARAIHDRLEVPVVFLTSHSDSSTLSRASTAQPLGYVMKPYAERDLRVAIELALYKHSLDAERRALEQRVVRSERLASLGTMAAGVCHEVNNPLTSVLANLDNCLAAPDQTTLGELRAPLRDVREAALRIADIVKSMRVFAQPGEERRLPVTLRDVLDSAVKFTAHVVRQRARLEAVYGAAPLVLADPSRLQQVFVNLIVNAAQAMPPGDAARHRIELTLGADAAGDAVAEVRDDGEGIAPEHLSRIFDPFFTTKAPGSGMGLGLSICNSIVEAFGGDLSVRSTVGAGTTFRVRLPAALTAEVAPAAKPAPPSAAPATRARVLIVDDEALVARALQRALGAEHQVETCSDGTSALTRLLGPEWFDVVLCDLLMPNMTGQQLYEAVRAARPELAERFVFLTGGAVDASREFLERTHLPVLFKPITDLAELRARVHDVLVTHMHNPLNS